MMAERRIDVERLNELARHRRADAGEVNLHDVIDIGHRDFAVGDDVIFLRNDRQRAVANGDRGTVTQLDHSTRTITVELHDGHTVEIDHDYLANNNLDWGYASTVHKNQGATCDHAYLLASDRTYRELGYVALSRGRIHNRIWTITDHNPDPIITEPHGAIAEPVDPLQDLRRSMSRANAHQMAIDLADDLEPVGIDL